MEPGPRKARKRRSHWPDPASVLGTRTLALSAPRLAPVRGSRVKRQPGSATGGGGATSRSTGRAPSVRGGCCYSLCYLPKRSEEHTSELQSLMRISYAVFCLKKKK